MYIEYEMLITIPIIVGFISFTIEDDFPQICIHDPFRKLI